ncbi:ribosomal protein S16 [Suhomyces tanzawaensis NRRL Y-17324]|uniref:Ribosomal protein S16 n=1 Tax=Suhomyces tanzawaensis NRRL Y-17324 TaxID=984487 RepID=A0A1E4SRG6_9ASCO|nr:ribosomal protein S16 [Suhomyces tanzawaensis NRRL Y-17324]ODV82106.1 ribosomal protein S16 [Suhomyces tanzawaensis NRRL Y-17324]
MSLPIVKSPLRIRLARFGRKHQPLYNIVVAKKGSARDSLPIEVLGTYNPVPVPLTPEEKAAGVKAFKDIQLDFNRSKYWVGVGADVSERVTFLFKKAGLLPETWPKPHKLTQHVEKEIVKDSTVVYEKPRELYRKR